MTQYLDNIENIASDFIVRACQLLPKPCAVASVRMRNYVTSTCLKPFSCSIFCGSSEEFYIRPLNPCIDDTDALLYLVDELAFVDDFPMLPNDLSRLGDRITCCKIEPYQRYPSFVRLSISGKMNYNWKYKRYEFYRACFPTRYAKIDIISQAADLFLYNEPRRGQHNTVRGPAITLQREASVGHDVIKSVWCPQWPKEAQSWPKRPRDYGWPTTATILEVVQNGCYVVYVQHRFCRDDKEQWRLSFSIAEVILLQSWTKVQQLVYHLLRFFAKRELIQKEGRKEDEVLCTYHLKTLMLWTCEEMSPEWWNSSSVIAICCDLLQKLSEWLKRRYCPNYFIPEANLFHEQLNPKMCERSERQLDKFCNSGILCHWFVENYILSFTRRHFKVEVRGKVTPHFMDHLQTINEFWKVGESKSLDLLFSIGFAYCNKFARVIVQSEVRVDPRTCLRLTCLTRKLEMLMRRDMLISLLSIPESVHCLTYFDTAQYSLNAAYDLKYEQIPWDSELFADYVKGIFFTHKIVRCRYHIFPEPLTAERSQFQFLRAQDFMENLTGLNSPSEFQLISLMSKEFLRKALQCDDSQSKIIAPAASVYLAALHFATSDYQTVIDLCSAVLMSQMTDLENETLNAGCLFFIVDVARFVGFCLLCMKFNKTIHFSMREIYLDLRLTPKVFAYYLTVISAEGISKKLELNLSNSDFPLDQVLLVLAKRKSCRPTSIMSNICLNAVRHCAYRRTDSLTGNANLSVDPLIEKEKIINILLEFALENMTSFYSLILKDFNIQCNTVDCYRAMYLYKCRQYGEVLHLCERILQEPDLQSDLKKLVLANVLMMPPLDSFFDGDVQCLLGFHTLFHYLSPLNNNIISNNDLGPESTFAYFIVALVHSSDGQLSVSFESPYSTKYHYFLGRHFLARYLKLRCCIDCKQPLVEAIDEFAAMKSDLPFEHIIRRFIQRKLHHVRNNFRILS